MSHHQIDLLKKTYLVRLHSNYLLEKSAEHDAQVANPPDFAAQCSAGAGWLCLKKISLENFSDLRLQYRAIEVEVKLSVLSHKMWN